jgi:hypothetical protein
MATSPTVASIMSCVPEKEGEREKGMEGGKEGDLCQYGKRVRV